MSAPTDRQLDAVVGLVVERLLVTDGVAAAKFGSGSSVDDPEREERLLDQVRAQSGAAGVDPDLAVAFMRDQITASKVVQRGLLTRWAAWPDEAPTASPDLRTVRERLDRLTTDLLRELAAVGRIEQLAAGDIPAVERLDELHRTALDAAMRSVGGS